MQTLEDHLEAAGLRFTVEGGKSFFDRQEVHETLAVLRAIDDPSDRIAQVAALRSSFFGVSDLDIVSYSLSGGTPWQGAVDDSRPGAAALAPAMRLIEELHQRARHASVPAVLERLYDETRVLAALTGSRRGEAQVANLEKIAALAREAASLGALTLRGFANLLQDRIQNAREEPDLPSTRPGDPDTIRVLSIHKAKGLEAPVVALFDTDDSGYSPIDIVPQWKEGRIAIGFRSGCQPQGWDALVRQEDKKSSAEARRLLYVACTRARDLLVIPRPPFDAAIGAFWKELVDALPQRDDACVRLVDVEPLPRPDTPGPRTRAVGDRGRRGRRRRRGALGAGAARARRARRRAPVPSRLRSRDLVAAHRRRRRWRPSRTLAGAISAAWCTRSSSGCHSTTRRRNGAERVRAMAEAMAPSHGLDATAAARAGEQVERVLALPVVGAHAAPATLWRELPFWFPDGDRTSSRAVVDLVFEEDGELVVVDYKSDAIADEQALEQAAHHALQLQLYGRGLTQALGLPVASGSSCSRPSAAAFPSSPQYFRARC